MNLWIHPWALGAVARVPSPTGGWCCLRDWQWGSLEKLVRAAFPEWLGRTHKGCLEPLLGKYFFEGGVHVPGEVGGAVWGMIIRIIYVLL